MNLIDSIVKWTSCLSPPETVQVRIPLRYTVFLKMVVENNENEHKEP